MYEAELTVERKIIELARTCGGKAYKFTSPSTRSVPDRVVYIPRPVRCPTCGAGDTHFMIEAKATGKASTGSQLREQQVLRRLGVRVYEASSTDSVIAIFAAEQLLPQSTVRGLDIV